MNKKKSRTDNIFDGQPIEVPLRKFEGDDYPRGAEVVECCDCGLSHMFTFEVTDYDTIVLRAYRLPKR